MELSRRNFIKGSAAAGAAASLAGVALVSGCSSASPSPSSAEGGAASSAEDVKYPEARKISIVEFESDVSQKTTQQIECDIAIIGAGGSGMTAAVRAAELGASVIVFEKGSVAGGSTAGTEGMFGWGSKLQERSGVELASVGKYVEEENIYTNYRSDAVLWTTFIKESGKTADWLEEGGYQFDRVDVYKSSINTFKCFHFWGGHDDENISQSGATLVEFLENRAKDLGVEFRFTTPAVCLKTDSGKVVGLYARDENGDYIEVTSKAVIAGCGGYAANNKLIEQLTTWDMTHANAVATGTGDGVIMAEDVGAGTYMTAMLPAVHVEGYVAADPITVGCCNQPLLFLNQKGNRCMDESLFIHSHKALFVNAVLTQKRCWSVFDQATLDRFESGEGIMAGWRMYKPGSNIEGLVAQVDECVAAGAGNAFKADTVEALAEAMGIDTQNFTANIERYNEFCSNGVDEDYLKDAQYLLPVESGPFYAIRVDPTVTNTIGGLDVNYDNQVLNENEEPIEGLYCVGVDGNKLYKETYNYGLSGGLVSYAIYSGLRAAEHACENYVS